MKAVYIEEIGGIERLKYGERPKPTPGAGEVLVKVAHSGVNFVEAARESLDQDTDVDWRPRVPQWPAIGDTMATAVQSALVGQKKPKEALDEAQTRIEQILKS